MSERSLRLCAFLLLSCEAIGLCRARRYASNLTVMARVDN
jgi:hypothetical protein